jgi:hypothetical protein
VTVFDFFTWCHDTAIAVAIRDSLWLFPALQALHLIALAALGGVVLVVDLRLLGLGLTRVPVRTLARDLSPWMARSLFLIVVTGVGMFLSEAVRYYGNAAFTAKIAAFALALVFTYGVRSRWTSDEVTPAGGRTVGAVSILLWTAVAGAGRAVGFW